MQTRADKAHTVTSNDSYPSAPLRTFAVIWVICVVLTGVAAWLLKAGIGGIDDAYIFFVYADNLVQGHGFVYNPGGERVEGFSSLAWVLLLAAVFGAGGGTPVVFIICSLLAASGLYALYSVRPPLYRNRALSGVTVFAAAWMLAAPGWYLWHVASLMDLALWTCLLSWAVALFIRCLYAEMCPDMRPTAAVYALMILTRPEALAWVPFFLLALYLLAQYRSFSLRRLARLPFIASLGALAGVLIFRLAYFGYPLPNTYYAKVSPDFFYNLADGFAYIADYLSGAGFAGLAVLLAVVMFARRVPALIRLAGGQSPQLSREQFAAAFLAAVIVAALCITALKGGDHFGGARFLKPLYAFAALWFVYLAAILQPAWTRRGMTSGRTVLSLMLLTVLLALPLRGAWYNIDRTGIWQEFATADEGLATARLLAVRLEEAQIQTLPEVGVTGAGGFNYAWQGDVFDLMGLNDLTLAHTEDDRRGYRGHAAFNAHVFFARQPEIILPHIEGWPGVVSDCAELQSASSFYGRVLDGLQDMPEFNEHYRFVSLNDPAGKLCFYARRDWLSQTGFTD